jgi:hypothetical protein
MDLFPGTSRFFCRHRNHVEEICSEEKNLDLAPWIMIQGARSKVLSLSLTFLLAETQ